MRRLLWIGDAGCQSGFARATHNILEEVRKDWEPHVLGINYRGDPHPFPYKMYPAQRNPGDIFGIRRLQEMLDIVHPDLIVIQNDPWNFPAYMKKFVTQPVVGIVAVDGKNCRGTCLNGLRRAIFWTEFGKKEAQRGGFTGEAGVVPLGVDLDIYRPKDKIAARRAMGIPKAWDNIFLVGNLNRNQPRKRMDLTIQYFAEWIRTDKIGDAYLFLHVAPTGDSGYDCAQLAQYYGVENRLILSEPEPWNGASEDKMADFYSALDVQVTTTQGEGWGLTTLEGMACGVPQIVPRWSALGEWADGSSYEVPCTSTAATFDNINAIGGIADRNVFIQGLRRLYSDKEFRNEISEKGLALAQEDRFRWQNIGQAYAQELEKAALINTEMLEPA